MIAIALYVLAMLLSFVLLARVVDLFFVKSLDKISGDLRLSNDAAGATLMAVGSSAPELFVALFAILKPGNHQVIGIGSIVGSAIFNLLVIVGATALIKKAKLTWQPIFRDLLFYLISVALLVWFIHDGSFSIDEATIFLAVYVVYVVAVIYWRRILPYSEKELSKKENKPNGANNKYTKPIDYLLQKIFPSPEHYYIVFLVSILTIAGLSYVLVEVAVRSALLLNIPESIIALTVLAVGTSIPDLFSSIIVARQGRGEMAVSNAVGSNIFDILVGLGLPFLVVMLISGKSIDTGGGNLTTSSLILFASIIMLFIVLIISRWKVGKITGILLLGVYIFYLIHEIIIL